MGACFSLYGPREVESHINNYYSVGLCSMRGCRKSLEDRYCTCLSIPNHAEYSIFAVFDGFNGDKASQYLSKHLVTALSKLKTLSDSELISQAISKMDSDILKLPELNASGSTIVFALIKASFATTISSQSSNESFIPQNQPYLSLQSTIHSSSSNSCVMDSKQEFDVRIFWVGDSPSYLIDKSDCTKLTTDHHWSLPSEQTRITESDTIINGKINGITELSRSFGCYSMKNGRFQKHVCIADWTRISAESGQTILLCSDGLTQKWSAQKLAQKYKFHSNQTKDDSEPIQNAVEYLCDECIDDGSVDNITVIAVQFK